MTAETKSVSKGNSSGGLKLVGREKAERVGFEPTVELPPLRFSRPACSAAPAPLRIKGTQYSTTGRYCFGLSFRDTELMQYRSPVGFGPSGKTCPRCAPQDLHVTSVRVMPWLRSVACSTFSSLAGS
jgi:hypothetical protein